MTSIPWRIVSSGRHLYGMLQGRGNDLVLLLPPVGEERKGAVRPLAEWARLRASQGRAVIFVDYAGCGESPGDFAEVTWQNLVTNARDALAAARERAGCAIGCVACRLGARLALEAMAAQTQTVRKLCLLDPVFDSRAWLRDLRRRSRFRGTATPASEEGEDIDGNLFSHRLLTDLENLAAPPPPPPCPTLIVALGPRETPAPALQEIATRWAAEIRCLAMPSFWQESDPFDAGALLDLTSAWFAE